MDKDYYSAQTGDNRFYVYLHRRLSDNKVFYVGKGTKNRAWRTDARSKHWFNVVNKHGYHIEIVFDNLLDEEAYQVEIDTILEFQYFQHPLVNLTSGGEGVRGHIRTAEHIENGRIARANSAKWWAGVQITADKLRGRKLSPEHCKAIGDGNRGKVASEKAKTNLSNAKKSDSKAMEHMRQLGILSRDSVTYSFVNTNGEVFNGTRHDFHVHTRIPKKEINKLFAKRNTRLNVYKWSLVVSTSEAQ